MTTQIKVNQRLAAEREAQRAKMEDQHEHKFAAMRKKMSETQEYLAEFDPDDGAGLYLQFSVESDIFENLKRIYYFAKRIARHVHGIAAEADDSSMQAAGVDTE